MYFFKVRFFKMGGGGTPIWALYLPMIIGFILYTRKLDNKQVSPNGDYCTCREEDIILIVKISNT